MKTDIQIYLRLGLEIEWIGSIAEFESVGKMSMVSISQSPSLKIFKSFLISSSRMVFCQPPLLFHFSSHPQMQATKTTCLGNYSNNHLNVSLF